MDIALLQNSNGQFDIAMDGPGLKSDNGLRTAVLISLFTNSRAQNDDVLPGNDNNRQGYWGDHFSNSSMGSRLWLLERESNVNTVLSRTQEYATEALQWLVNDGIAQTVTVTTNWFETGKLGIYVVIVKGNGSTWQETFNYELKAA